MIKNYDLVMFDQDGTLLNTGFSIIRAITDVLKQEKIPLPKPEECRKFVGPPIRKGLAKICHLDEEECNRVALIYRKYYEETYWKDNCLYPGIMELLDLLKEAGTFTAVATSRPKSSAMRILAERGLKSKFNFISCPEDKKPHTSKRELIGWSINNYIEKNGNPPKSAIMIGDTIYDIMGAKEAGIESVAVRYGYGIMEEFDKCQPTFFANNVGDLKDILLMDWRGKK